MLVFDNQKGIEYLVDLTYPDLLEMTDGNVNLLNTDEDLAKFLSNSLAYFWNTEGEEILVCEHRLFFCDYSAGIMANTERKPPADSFTKMLQSKHNKRDKLLHKDSETETDLELNIIHEAFDVLFKETIYAYN
jgi:hypothetical protein